MSFHAGMAPSRTMASFRICASAILTSFWSSWPAIWTQGMKSGETPCSDEAELAMGSEKEGADAKGSSERNGRLLNHRLARRTQYLVTYRDFKDIVTTYGELWMTKTT